MTNFRELEERIARNNRVEGHELEELKAVLGADRKIDRKEADFLVVLHKRVTQRSPAFEQFFYNAIKRHVLTDGRVGAEETAWLRQMLSHDRVLSDLERKFLHELRGEVRQPSPEFEALCKECTKPAAEGHGKR